MQRDNTTPPKIVLLVGAARVGKDTIGSYLKQHHGFARSSFAKPLYDALMPLYGVDALDLHGDREVPIPRLERSIRELVQDLGDHVRQQAGPQILIRRLVQRAVARGEWGGVPMVITDGRTEAEIDWARTEGAAVWWVRSANAQLVRPHTTERVEGLRIKLHQPGDFTITNDGTLEQLYLQVDQALYVMRAAA